MAQPAPSRLAHLNAATKAVFLVAVTSGSAGFLCACVAEGEEIRSFKFKTVGRTMPFI